MRIKKFNNYSNIIGANIKKYRMLKGLSQREFSNKLALLGIDLYHSDISCIEHHTLFVKDFEILAICKVLDITISQLFEDCDKFFDY